MAIFIASFLVAFILRFQEEWMLALLDHWAGIFLGGAFYSCAAYIFGFYSFHGIPSNPVNRMLAVSGAVGLSALMMLGFFYLFQVTGIGRGAMALGAVIALGCMLMYYSYIRHREERLRERMVVILTSLDDEHELMLNRRLWELELELVGVVTAANYHPGEGLKVLGKIGDLPNIVRKAEVTRVVCAESCITTAENFRLFSELRYSGVLVMPLISMCEEFYQFIPLGLVTPGWLLAASGSPRLTYIRKMKRAFDIVFSLLVLLALSIPFVIGVILVRLTSKGPIFYRQVRSGRFGNKFEMLKLRSMRVDAEAAGVQWAKDKDPRVTPVGEFLRKYRIDEIPQLLNVLKGEMSLVGPRPERPEFVTKLAERIPYFQERLMIQPGITGWAQVKYPYGASIEDTRKKLEYDLYYMKHMSLLLDLFILLDTVRTMLSGGLGQKARDKAPHYHTRRSHAEMTAEAETAEARS
ncbi:MAG: sugar transferase [Verrucomicrobia bacterium]|jgi:exopolysaccharide biosynthesis polyprenyl glycosylphosphotransferase|nr:sugar transferase [Verrucomicrobiota bacterium]